MYIFCALAKRCSSVSALVSRVRSHPHFGFIALTQSGKRSLCCSSASQLEDVSVGLIFNIEHVFFTQMINIAWFNASSSTGISSSLVLITGASLWSSSWKWTALRRECLFFSRTKINWAKGCSKPPQTRPDSSLASPQVCWRNQTDQMQMCWKFSPAGKNSADAASPPEGLGEGSARFPSSSRAKNTPHHRENPCNTLTHNIVLVYYSWGLGFMVAFLHLRKSCISWW